MSKETSYMSHVARVREGIVQVYISKETWKYRKRSTYIKRDLQMPKCTPPMSHVARIRGDIGWVYVHQKRPENVERDLHISKETCKCQKRPTYIKRDLQMSTATSNMSRVSRVREDIV